MNEKIIFQINSTDCIEVRRECDQCDMHDIYALDMVDLFLHNATGRYLVYYYDSLTEAINQLHDYLRKALNNELAYKVETKSIGLLWNEYLHKKDEAYKHRDKLQKKGLMVDIVDNSWSGEGRLMWSTPQDYDTWMYNDGDHIVIEVTPVYGSNLSNKRAKGYYPYQEFVRNFKPIAVYALSHERAAEWLAQTEQLIKRMNASFDKYAQSSLNASTQE